MHRRSAPKPDAPRSWVTDTTLARRSGMTREGVALIPYSAAILAAPEASAAHSAIVTLARAMGLLR